MNAQQISNMDLRNKSVRFDVFVKDNAGTLYNLEMQTTRYHHLSKRIRYDQAAIKANTVTRREEYSALPDSYVNNRWDQKRCKSRTEGVAIGETRTNEKLVRMMLQDHKDIREIHKIYWFVSCTLFV